MRKTPSASKEACRKRHKMHGHDLPVTAPWPHRFLASGYPRWWQAARTEAMSYAELAEAVGERVATPGATGLTQDEIDAAKAEGAALNAYPMTCYDEDGILDLRAVPNGPYAATDRICDDALALVEHIVSGITPGEYGRRHATAKVSAGSLARAMERMRQRTGLQSSRPDYRQRRAEVRDTLDAVTDGQIDPVYAALDLGAVRVDRPLTLTHPAVVAWLDDRGDAAAADIAAHRRRQLQARARGERVAA